MAVDFRLTAPKEVFPFLMVLETLSPNVFLVGGAVRDLLLGFKPKDFDFVTDTPMADLVAAFEEGGFKVSQTGVAHFVLNVSLNDFIIEVSNFRKDKVCDGRHADVEVGTITDDANRRDFTVNALYINTRSGEVIDPTNNGLHDIKANVLRFVGRPKDRIREDWLRVFRWYRFLGKGFRPDPKSQRAVREMFNEAFANTTPERVRAELEKMVS